MAIQQKVGLRSPNRYNDVLQVQKLLNQALKHYPLLKGHFSELDEDGNCGKLTLEAIKQFQIKVMNFQYPDTVVDPGGKTWKKLNGNLPVVQALSGKSSEWRASSLVDWLNEQIPQSVIDQYSEVERKLQNYASMLIGNDVAETKAEKSPIAVFRQGDSRWGKTKLGFGSGTIHGYGCTMTSLTMAATYLGSATSHWPKNTQPSQLTPLVVNSILKRAQAFLPGSISLFIVKGAAALGMEGKDSQVGVKVQVSDLQAIDLCLQEGGLALAHVDYKKDWVGDHWILIVEKSAGGEYKAIDPTYGKYMLLYASPDAGQKSQSHVLLYGRESSWIDKTPENVKRYKVVRYVTLREARK